MLYKVQFKSGKEKQINWKGGRNGDLELSDLIFQLIRDGRQFVTINSLIIRLDAIEFIEPN